MSAFYVLLNKCMENCGKHADSCETHKVPITKFTHQLPLTTCKKLVCNYIITIWATF